jgi:UDP-N-acetylglucosamine acyltransferase
MQSNVFELKNNVIDPTAIIEPGAVIGEGNTIGAYTVIRACVVIGNNNYIAPLVVIGEPAEYRVHPEKTFPEKVIIGNRNRISEFVAIQAGILTNGTMIGNDNYIMHGTHIAHDNQLGNGISIAPLVSIGGMVTLGDYVNFGMCATIHPRLKVGKGAMIGMNATVTKDVPEWETWAGTPAKFLKMNEKAMKKHEG